MITHMKDDGSETLEFYSFERPNSMKTDTPGPGLKKYMSYIAAKRRGFDNSILFCQVDVKKPEANKYYLLTIKGKALNVSTFKFEAGAEAPHAEEVELNITSDFDTDKFSLHDFKVSEPDD